MPRPRRDSQVNRLAGLVVAVGGPRSGLWTHYIVHDVPEITEFGIRTRQPAEKSGSRQSRTIRGGAEGTPSALPAKRGSRTRAGSH